MHVSLTPKLEEMVRRKVKSGLYNNASEVVREALRMMVARERGVDPKLEALREAVRDGKNSPLDKDFSFERLKAKLDVEARKEGIKD
jgi:antitoxin ParD1/3/4